MTDDQSIYTEEVLAHVEDPCHKGHLPDATHVHEAKNPLCGDRIRMELKINKNGDIEDIYFSGDGCKFSQAGASILLAKLLEDMDHRTVEDVKAITARQMVDMVAPRLLPLRQQCALLGWKVLQSAIYSPVTNNQ
jgi:nitrogen fixation protein NifU and related proteins